MARRRGGSAPRRSAPARQPAPVRQTQPAVAQQQTQMQPAVAQQKGGFLKDVSLINLSLY